MVDEFYRATEVVLDPGLSHAWGRFDCTEGSPALLILTIFAHFPSFGGGVRSFPLPILDRFCFYSGKVHLSAVSNSDDFGGGCGWWGAFLLNKWRRGGKKQRCKRE